MIEKERFEKVTVLRMAHGKVNALDIEFCEALRAHLADEKSGDTRAIVLTGTGSIFSAGVDLRRILREEKAYTERFLEVFSTMLLDLRQFPKPTVAAINGHAIAGGCVLACACDDRIMADSSGKIGLPELAVGVPFPTLAVQLLQSVLPPHYVPRLLYQGKTFTAEQALAHHLVNEAAPADALLERAMQIAQRYADLPPEAFAQTKRALQAHFLTDNSTIEREVVATWTADETRERIRNYMEKAIKKQ